MSGTGVTPLQKDLRANLLTWSALHHLLPVPILHELFLAFTDEISGGTVSLDDLFDYGGVAGPDGLESWALRQRRVDGPLASYLQHRLQHFLWRNDADAFTTDKATSEAIQPADVEAAVALGRADFGTHPSLLQNVRAQIEPNLALLLRLVDEGGRRFREQQLSGFANDVRSGLSSQDLPVKLAITKHLADLCADSDAWQEARSLYLMAQEFLGETHAPAWECFFVGLRDLLVQSLATAVRVTDGPRQAFIQLHNALEEVTLKTHPVLVLNAGFDALTAQSAAGDFHIYDRRATLLGPTFYNESYDLDAVVLDVNHGNFREAQRRCWAVLRRQIALGLASETRATKSIYGRALLAELKAGGIRRRDTATFSLAIRLLLESGDSAADRLEWDKELVEAYVDGAIVTTLVETSKRYKGTWPERGRVAVELLRGWSLRISDEKHAIADKMVQFLAEVARDESASVIGTQNLGGRSLEALRDVAKARPEFRANNADIIETSIAAKLRPQGVWKGVSSALELAIEYIDVFSSAQLRNILERTLEVLSAMDPAAQMWPVVRPALHLLSAKPSAGLCRSDTSLGQNVLATILRFGVQETQNSELLFYLRDFDPALLRDPQIVATLQPVVETLRKRVLTVNSSGTAGEIQALLLSPTISGLAGVSDALNALKDAMRSAAAKRPKLALSYGYAPLQMLVNRQPNFADELDVSRAQIDSLWDGVYSEVLALWGNIRNNPSLLAPFSIPPVDRADPVLVHNWTFASVRFAESLGKQVEMIAAVRGAAEQVVLRNPIQRALVTGATLDPEVATDPSTIATESEEVFYDALGRRLVLLDSLDQEAASTLCRGILTQCMRYGPRGLDAAVLMRASQLHMTGQFKTDLATNYTKRIDESRELRLSLMPLLLALGIQPD